MMLEQLLSYPYVKTFTSSTSIAPLDVWVRDQALHISIDLPGVREEDIEVTINNSSLTLEAHRLRLSDPTDKMVVQEVQSGLIRRNIKVSEDFDLELVSASLSDGVLHIIVPPSVSSKPRKVKISKKEPEKISSDT